MLTTSLIKPRVMPVVMPADGPPGVVPETQTITFCLGKNNKVVWYKGIGEKPLTSPKLVAYGNDMHNVILNNAKQILALTGKHMIVLVKPAEHSVYDNLVTTLDELNNTAVPTYAIAKISATDIAMLKQRGVY